MSIDIRAVLKKSSLFSNVNEESLRGLAEIAQIQTFEKEEVVFHEGVPAPGVFLVDTGMVRLVKVGALGKEHVLHMAHAGDTFAEVAVMGNFPLPATAESMEKSTCVLLPAEEFRKALNTDHALCQQILKSLSIWVRHFVGLLEGVVLKDAAGRLANYLLQGKKGNEEVTLWTRKKDVASHLNLTGETLSRILRQFKRDGIIEESKENQIALIDKDKLQRVAEGLFPTV